MITKEKPATSAATLGRAKVERAASLGKTLAIVPLKTER